MDEEKHAEASEGGESFQIVTPKIVSYILLIVLILGIFGKMLAPNLLAKIGPQILDPFTSILIAYGLIASAFILMGDTKTGQSVLRSSVLMAILAFVIGYVLGGAEYIIGPVLVMFILPLIVKKIHDKWLEPHGFSLGEGEGKEGEIDIKNIKEYARNIKEEIERVASNKKKPAQLFGTSFSSADTRIDELENGAHKLAHALMKKDEKELKKHKNTYITAATDLKSKANVIETEISSIYAGVLSTDPKRKAKEKTLDELTSAISRVKSKLSVIINTLEE